VVSEHDGRWGQAAEVPGLAGLNVGFGADIGQLACPSPGNCVAGGDYVNSLGVLKAFAVSEVRGHWEPAVPLSGAGLKASEYSSMTSASCSSAGNCTLAGTDRPATSAGNQAIVVRERDGQWGQATAISVPASLGSISMNIGTLSCAGDSSATQGNCLAGGFYETTAMRYRAWVVSEAGGRWGRALLVPGILTLNVGGLAVVNQVSCAAPGDCAAGGYYSNHAGTQAFLASQAGGRWGQAVEVPGLAALNTSGYAETASVSCPSAGNCAAVGWYNGRAGVQDFVIDQNAGRWGQAVEVPGLAALNARHVAHINSVSCPAAGRCVMAGEYADQAGQSEVFTDSQK